MDGGQHAGAVESCTGGHGCVGLAARDPEGCDIEKRESCHGFSHPSVPGEAFLMTRNHVTLKL